MTGAKSPPSAEVSGTDLIWSATDLKSNPHLAPDKNVRVQRMFAAIARHYDFNNRLHSLGRDQAWRRFAVRLAEVKPTDDVLDVACGTGDLALAFADAGARSVTGVDFTDQMLDIARDKCRRRASTRASACKPQFAHADAMDLPFPDRSFDIVSIAFGIRNVSDPTKALREFRRVLKAGGRLVVLEFSQPRNSLMRWLNAFYCGSIMPLTATLIARDHTGAYRYLPKSVATFPEGKAFTVLLELSGFTSPQARPLTFGVCTAYLARV